MELRLLEYFIAVCNELHFTKASEKLGISQPTLSQQIQLLEGRIGAQLFLRTGKKIQITDEGKLLLEHAKKIFSELDQAKMGISQMKGLQQGKLTIGCSGNHFLYPSIISFHEQYPKIELSVHDATTKKTIKKLLERDFDLGLVFLPVEHSQVESVRLFNTELSVVVSNKHPFADKKTIELKELQTSRLFLLQKEYLIRQDIERYCEERGIFIKPLVELSDMESLLEMTLIYNGVTILPTTYLNVTSKKNFHMIKIADPIPKRDVGVIYRKESHMSAVIKAFIQHLLKLRDGQKYESTLLREKKVQ